MVKNIIASLLFFIILGSCKNESGWQSLFNDRDLNGWHIKGGNAKFSVEDRTIVGETVLDEPSTFLCTDNDYNDFILELELFVDTSMNSGIQFRSHSIPEYKKGIVHGYQMEIDPSSRGWSGGIYDESHRGWLYTMDPNPQAKTAFINNEWNKYRIEAIGTHIKTYVNGIQTADLLDNTDSSGFIALQVHFILGIEYPWTIGTKVKWRNIRIMTENLEANCLKPSTKITQLNYIPNTISDFEKINGWKLLFDGFSQEGWTNWDNWQLRNGIISSLNNKSSNEEVVGGDLITSDEYGDFELSFEFMINEGANSGISYYVSGNGNGNGNGNKENILIGLEYQISDDQSSELKSGPDGNRSLASLYDLVPAQNKRENPKGVWNNARILSRNNHVEHWLNGFKVLEYTRNNEEFHKLVSLSKYKSCKNYGENLKGRISLQNGNGVSFRSIKIHELN